MAKKCSKCSDCEKRDKPEMRVERMGNGTLKIFGTAEAERYLGMPHQEIHRIVRNLIDPPPRVRAYMEKVRRIKEAYPELFKEAV